MVVDRNTSTGIEGVDRMEISKMEMDTDDKENNNDNLKVNNNPVDSPLKNSQMDSLSDEHMEGDNHHHDQVKLSNVQ